MRLTIIGGGPGGHTAAFEAAARGMEVTLVEKAALGGTCLHHGCIPTKTMRASADALVIAWRMAEFGVTGCAAPGIDPAAVQKRKNSVINTLTGGLEKTCVKLGIKLVHGTAEIKNAAEVTVHADNGAEKIAGDAVIIATGSQVMPLPGLEFDHKRILSSDDALDLQNVPARLLIVGGGVIGCELACIFRAFGSDVTIAEGQDRLLPMPAIDCDVSALLAREMRKHKIKMFTGATVAQCDTAGDSLRCQLAPSPFVNPELALKKPAEIDADMVFVTVGRAPTTAGLGLDQCGVATDKRGWINVDDRLRTSAPGIYAIGDAIGPAHVMLAHVAAMEGLTVVDGLSGGSGVMNYDAVPSAIFTEPEIGCVGLSESEARAKYANVVCGVAQMRELGKAQAMGELPGFFKIVANGDNGRILGIHIAGAHASDILAEATLAISQGLDAERLAATIHAHPTLAEGVFEASRTLCQTLRNNNKEKS